MNMSGESLLVILIVGVVAGWLAGQIVRGTGFGIVGDLIIGIIGAFIGEWLMPQIGIHLGTGIVAAIIDATIGALLLLLIINSSAVVVALVAAGGGVDAGDPASEAPRWRESAKVPTCGETQAVI